MANNNNFKLLTEKEKYVTGRVILQYINFREPYVYQQGSTPKYSCTVVIPKENSAEIENMKTIINKHYTLGKIQQGHIPLKDGSKLIQEKKDFENKEIDEKYNKFFVLKSSSAYKFKIVTADPKIKFTGEESELRGYWCRLSLEFYAYRTGTGQGISSYLKAVQVIEPSKIELPGGDNAINDFEKEETKDPEELPF